MQRGRARRKVTDNDNSGRVVAHSELARNGLLGDYSRGVPVASTKAPDSEMRLRYRVLSKSDG
jgi:hypothetical protein